MIIKLGKVISEYSVRNKADEDIPVYSVTNDKGFCTNYFSKDVSSKDRTTYKIVPYGYFAYNPSRINVGSVDWQHYEKKVIVSPLYVVFYVDEVIDQRYLLHYLKSDITLKFIKSNSAGSVRDNLKLSVLQEFSINLRTKEEQYKIVNILDKVDLLISLYTEKLEKFDELTKSLFIEMFGDPSTNPKKWVKTPLHKLCHISSSRRIYQNEQTLQGIPFLRISDLSNLINNGNTKVELYISEERYEELKSKNQVPKSGDILITSRGTLGECYIIKEDDKFYFQDGMISWMFDFVNYILPTYLKYLFDMREFKREITSRQIGTTVSYLSIEMIKKLQIMLPNIKLQYKFSELINKIDKSKLAVKKSLEELEILKKSLMQKYFA